MTNNVYVDFFWTNNPDLKVEDIISNVRIGTTPEGVAILSFNTTDKYVDIDDSMHVHRKEYEGHGITIHPYIFNDESKNTLSQSDAWAYPIKYHDWYLDHPDFYNLTLVVNGTSGYISKVFALKHEYRVLFIPFEVAYNSDCLQDIELIRVQQPKINGKAL